MKKLIILISVFSIALIGGTVGFFVHSSQVQMQQKQAQKEEYQKQWAEAEQAIQLAYDTRKTEDMANAQLKIKQLKNNDQEILNIKITNLQESLAQIQATEQLLVQAETSQAEGDIAQAQQAIYAETGEYLAQDRKAHQERLDKIQQQIAPEAPQTEIEPSQPTVQYATTKNGTNIEKNARIPVQFSRHTDGDTSEFLLEGEKIKVRYLLIDTPESVKENTPVQPFGAASSQRTKELLTNASSIEMMLDKGEATDKYERMLAYIFVNGELLQEILVREGLARVAYIHEPSTTYLAQLQAAQTQAKQQKIGIWSIDGYVTEKGFNS